MAPKKRLTKKEMKQDELKIALMNLIERYMEHQKAVNYIVFGLAAVLVIGLLLRVSIVNMNKNAAQEYDTAFTNYQESRLDQAPQAETGETAQSEKDKLMAAKSSFEIITNTYSHSKVYPYSLLMLGNTELELGNFDAAVEKFNKFLEKYDDSALAIQATVGKAYAYEHLGELAKAAELLKSALDGPFDYYSKSELYLDLARVQEQLGDVPGALEYYRKYEEEFPEARRITVVKDKLSSLS